MILIFINAQLSKYAVNVMYTLFLSKTLTQACFRDLLLKSIFNNSHYSTALNNPLED